MTRFVLNGKPVEAADGPPRTLLYALREELSLHGPKYGCGEGECGVCSVLVDGQVVRSCVTPLGDAAGKRVTTIEGLAPPGRLHPVQAAFAELGAMQCGYCTPGMALAAAALLETNADPSEAAIKAALEGNVCRCGTYPRIVRAVRLASEIARGVKPAPAPPLPAAPIPDLQPKAMPWDELRPDQRGIFDVLGEGVAAVVPPSPPRGGPPRGGAWVHVAASGAITAGTGKMEMGQGTRTGLSLLVAEELRAPPDRVALVMGDTDLSPWDMGTFGSRSTPDAGTDLRQAAAAARELIAGLAAARWKVERSTLALDAGEVRRGSQRATFGELVRGERRLEVVQGDAKVTPAEAWTAAGHEAKRVGTLEMVTGAKRYASDFARPGMLHGKALRPPAFGAKLRLADVSGARAFPGVTVVQDGEFVGVAAPTPLAAHAALEAVKADWQLAPQPGEADIADYLRAHPIEATGWEGAVHRVEGDVEATLARAQARVEATYTAAYLAHVPIEPRVAVAEWSGDRVTVWASTQVPFMSREALAEALTIPEARVHVVALDMGDGFGGKHATQVALEAAKLARAAGRPVKVLWGRDEEFTWGHFRPYAVIDVRAGAGADGLAAWEFKNTNAGPAALQSPYAAAASSVHYQPAASPLRQGPYRSLAAATNNFARESAIDELAVALGEDPLAFRLRLLPDERLRDVLKAAAERCGWGNHVGSPGFWGVACGMEKGGRVATCVEVRLDGGAPRVHRVVTAYDCGAIVNPDGVRNQIEGGTVMALGGALFEAVHFAGGRVLNPRYADYRVPRFSDVPAIEAILIDRRDQPSMGAGETPIIAVAPAIASALFRATGERRRALPLLGAAR
ncbi:MAG TPA: molybdopterin cofactor-binding domain-containing protein [Myxococcales bacterium]|nr:molybdopterin cofactor-binding domain-containing protein [Myxococcales bacterium]